MKKIRFGVMGFVAALVVAFICAGCNDGGVENGGGDAVAFLNRFRAGGASYTTSFKDERDGKPYKAVKMPDGKTWMAENLNYTSENITGKCYDNEESYCDRYGRLYNWDEANNSNSCPPGWKLPSENDWNNLIIVASPRPGTKLKSKDGWLAGGGYELDDINGTDDFKFSALPGGCLLYDCPEGCPDGKFISEGYSGSWWTSTVRDVTIITGDVSSEGQSMTVVTMEAPTNYVRVSSTYDKNNAYSVRCFLAD
jgi:uncharacterized protein (TIGR02145 family)